MDNPRRNFLKTLGVVGSATVSNLLSANSTLPIITMMLQDSNQVIFSECQITRAIEDCNGIEVDFNFLVETDSQIDFSTLSTIEFEFVFEPGNKRLLRSGEINIDAQGNGAYITIGITNLPADVLTYTYSQVQVVIKKLQGLDESNIKICASPLYDVSIVCG